MKVHYNPKLKGVARKLRKSSTLSEVLPWQYLKRKQMMGYDFHRQKPIDEYVVDFFYPELGLIIEIDGETNTNRIKDQRRQEKLESLGFHFLRFWDEGTHNESPLREGCPAALLTDGVCHPIRGGCSLQRRGELATGGRVMGRSTDCVDAPERPGIQ